MMLDIKDLLFLKNLLRFDVYVYAQEIRKFKTVRNWLGALDKSKDQDDTLKLVNENTSQVGFKFTECMFDPAASGNVFEGVTKYRRRNCYYTNEMELWRNGKCFTILWL